MNIPAPKQRFIIPDLPKTEDIIPYLKQIDENRWYSNFGPLVHKFQTDFIQMMGKAHNDAHPYGCAAMASGYYALNVGLRLLGIEKGSTVLVPSVTFPACALVVQNMNANLLLSDVDKDSWVLTPDIAKEAAKHNKIDAVMPVSIYGMEVPADEWDLFAKETGIKVIIDAAAAVETQKYLKYGVVAHSLHALKPFGIGEGGVLVTPNNEQAEIARQSINFGMQHRITSMRGENAKMSEYHAAVALAQIKRWDDIKDRRKNVANLYFEELKSEERVTPHAKLKETIASCLMITLNKPKAKEVLEKLVANNVAAHRTYLPPLYKHPYFKNIETIGLNGKKCAQKKMSGSEFMDNHVLGLPFHSFMDKEEIKEYITILSKILDNV